MINKILFIGFFALISLLGNAKVQTNELDSLLDSILFDENDGVLNIESNTKKFHFLYGRLNYDSNTFFAGRDIGINQYCLTSQIAYFHSSGFNLGAATAYYSQMNPNISTIMLMAGYSGQFSKKSDFRYRFSYSRYLFPDSSLKAVSTFNSSASVGLTYYKKIMGARINYSLLMGSEYNSQVSLDIYSRITLLKFGTFNRIRFEPELSFYIGNEKTSISQVGILSEETQEQYTYLVEKDNFGLMNTSINLPITVDYKNFDFELGYNFNIPRSFDSTENPKTTSFINFSIGYIISLPTFH